MSSINQQMNISQNYGFEGMDDCCIYTLDNGKKIIQDCKICNIIRGSTQSLKLNYDKKIR